MADGNIAFVIAVFNGAKTLARTLLSLSQQTVQPHEVIVMDGGSADGTQDILGSSTVVTFWQSGPDGGIYDAWNKALVHVKSDWVVFLGADDYLWDARVLERMVPMLASTAAEVPFVYGRLMEVSAEGATRLESGKPWRDCKARFRYAMDLPHPGMFHRRSICFANGGFDTRYRIAGDYSLLRPVLLRHDPVFVDLLIAGAQEGGISTRADRRVLSVREAGKVITASGDSKPWRWYAMLAKNHVRYWLWRLVGDDGLAFLLRHARRGHVQP